MLNCNSIANLLREICEKIAVCVMCLTPEMFGRIGKSNGILAPVSLGAHPRSSPHLDAASHLGTAFFPPRPC